MAAMYARVAGLIDQADRALKAGDDVSDLVAMSRITMAALGWRIVGHD
jgi:hypothetical protein